MQALAGQRQPVWQCARCYTRSFLSKRALPELWNGERVAKGLVCRRERSDCALAAPERWRDDLWSGCASCWYREGTGCVLAQTRLQLTQAREQGHPEECIRISECKVLKEEPEMRQAEPMETRREPDFVEPSRRARRHKGPGELRAQEVVQAQLDLHKPMQEAPLPVMPAPQANVNQVKSLEALTGMIENVWNPEAGPPPDALIHAIQESRAILQTSSAILSQGGGAAVEAETGAEQDPELWDQDGARPRRWQTSRRRTLQEDRQWSRGRDARPRRNAHLRRHHSRRKPQSRRRWQKGALSQVQLTTRAMQNPSDTELDTLSQRACALIPALASS